MMYMYNIAFFGFAKVIEFHHMRYWTNANVVSIHFFHTHHEMQELSKHGINIIYHRTATIHR